MQQTKTQNKTSPSQSDDNVSKLQLLNSLNRSLYVKH